MTTEEWARFDRAMKEAGRPKMPSLNDWIEGIGLYVQVLCWFAVPLGILLLLGMLFR